MARILAAISLKSMHLDTFTTRDVVKNITLRSSRFHLPLWHDKVLVFRDQ